MAMDFFIFCSILFHRYYFSLFFIKNQSTSYFKPFDILGFLSSSLGLSLFFYALTILSNSYNSLWLYLFFIFSFICFIVFFNIEYKHKYPLINLKYFKNCFFNYANLLQFFFQICHVSSFVVIALYLQLSVGMTPIETGITIGMQALGAICISRFSVKLFNLYGVTYPIICGFIGINLFLFIILLVKTPDQLYFAMIVLFFRGLFSGICGVPIQTTSALGFSHNDLPRASSIFIAGRQISISFGIAISSLLIHLSINKYAGNQTLIGHYEIFHNAFIFMAVMGICGVITACLVNNRAILTLTQKN